MLNLVAFAVAALGCIVLIALLEHRTGLPSAVALVVVGLIYGLLPGPNIRLDPQLVLVLVLPPLLYSAALDASLLEIRNNLRPIVSLSVLLVLLTALVAGVAAAAVVPGLPLAAAIALGAAVAPTDPVASLAVGRRAGLPPRLIGLIEEEGLLNDATALTAFEVAVAVGLGGDFSPLGAGERFVFAALGGLLIGLSCAWVIRLVRRRIDDPLQENALSLATPFLVYVAAEEVHGSGILAVVVAGLWLGHQAPVLLSSASRLQTRAFWRMADFLLAGLVFLLIGDQLPAVLSGLEAYPLGTVLAAAAASVAAVLLTRPIWLALSFYVFDRILPGRRSPLGLRELVALSWAGTRGIISLAAIFTLPLGFPFRDLLLFCTYIVVLTTLVGQGGTFSWLMHVLRLGGNQSEQFAVWRAARTAAIEAGLQRLDELTAEEPSDRDLADVLRRRARERDQLGDAWARSLAGGSLPSAVDSVAARVVRLRRQMIDAERNELMRWRDAGRLPESGLRALERELDYEESGLP